MQEMKIQFLDQKDPLEKEMATQSSILAWEIPWTEKPEGLWSMGLQKRWTWVSDKTAIWGNFSEMQFLWEYNGIAIFS